MGLIARILTGGLSGGGLALAGGKAMLLGALCGAVSGVAGAFLGYSARSGLVKTLRAPDRMIAIPEDLVALALGWLSVSTH